LKNKAFTLIELLIVVAIIAILAAIAVPNFLEAQTRAKVSRCKNDLRAMATAIESYAVDNNKYPTDSGNGNGVNPNFIYRPYGPPNTATHPMPNFSIGFEITTPIAYLSSMAPLVDIFKTATFVPETDQLWGRKFYNFNSLAMRFSAGAASQATYNINEPNFGAWCLMGAGPDRFVNNQVGQADFGPAGSLSYRGKPYDATNGTVSNGDIYRSHKFNDGARVLTFAEAP